ncbi:MAG: pentapeptide repeat-containing protein, partial [Rhodospirillaceae bacterium]|nr:pentapeptide repeat-containing protein [Rhodospirillaceae bacterium]
MINDQTILTNIRTSIFAIIFMVAFFPLLPFPALAIDYLMMLKKTGACPNCELEGVDLKGAMLVNADLSGAKMWDADLKWADLSGANLSAVQLQRADMEKARLINTNLENAKLRYADAEKSNFTAANMNHADLREVDFENSRLRG